MINLANHKSLEARQRVWAALDSRQSLEEIVAVTGLASQTVGRIIARWRRAGLVSIDRRLVRSAWRAHIIRRPLKRWATTAVEDGNRALSLDEQGMLWRASRAGRSTTRDLAFACGLPPLLCSPYMSHLVLAGYYDMDAKGRLCLGAWSGPESPRVFTTGITFDVNLCDVVWSPVERSLDVRRAA